MNYIVYADDDEDDQDLMREVLSDQLPLVNLIVKDNGENLLDFLIQLDKDDDSIMLIILDLNMPGWDGIETLRRIRQIDRYNDIPVIIFSTTANETDRNMAFLEGAVAFIRKPSSYSELQVIIQSFSSYFKP
jgi:CheY-like chemotaxis protein